MVITYLIHISIMLIYISWHVFQSPCHHGDCVVFLRANYFLVDDCSKSVPCPAHYINDALLLFPEELHKLRLI